MCILLANCKHSTSKGKLHPDATPCLILGNIVLKAFLNAMEDLHEAAWAAMFMS
jgi:hypothetical protein